MKRVSPYLPGILLFLAAAVIAMLVYQDYGIAWDEPIQRELGSMSYQYAVNGDTAINANADRRLGTGYELVLIVIERTLHLHDTRDIYLARHLTTHIFFLLSAFCMYILSYRLFRRKALACLAFVLLAFHPRLYAHSFFNSKDIPFLCAFLISLLVFQVAFQKNKALWYMMLGAACAYATSIRAMGVMLALVACMFLLIDLINAISTKQRWQPAGINTIIFIASFCAVLYISWPYLWPSPVHNFIEAFASLANIGWAGKVNLGGTFYAGDKLPLSYMPAWFAITVPELWLLAGLAGWAWIFADGIRQPRKYLLNTPARNFLLYFLCFIAPIAAMVLLHGVNIDDWRHLYFIYPSFVMLAVFAISKLWNSRHKTIIMAACAIQIGLITFFMITAHPFQQVYFNNLISHKPEYLRRNYDLEYWGCSYKQALEYLIKAHPNGDINIAWDMNPLANNIMILPQRDRKRIKMVDGMADYKITNFRMHPDEFPYPQVEYSIKRLNSTILCVYKTHL